MDIQQRSADETRSSRISIAVIRVASLVALCLATYLATLSVDTRGPVGCGGLSSIDCDHVLKSRWSTWLGIPVSYLSIVVYVSILGLSFSTPFRRDRRAAVWPFYALCLLVGFAALWFTGLQVVVVGKLCLYCLGIHACGVVVAATGISLCIHSNVGAGSSNRQKILRPLFVAAIGMLPLVIGQLLIVPKGYEFTELDQVDSAPLDDKNAELVDDLEQPAPDGEKVAPVAPAPIASTSVFAGRKTHVIFGSISIDCSTNPLVGDPNASQFLVELFDYSCDNCRTLHKYLDRYQDERQLSLSMFVLPVPMNVSCNPYISKTGSKHIHACELCKIALAVFAAKPEQFPEFHEWMMQGTDPPTVAGAEDYARRVVGADEFEKAMNNPATDAKLRSYVQLFKTSKAGIVPKLIYNTQMIVGTPTEYGMFAAALDKMMGLTQ